MRDRPARSGVLPVDGGGGGAAVRGDAGAVPLRVRARPRAAHRGAPREHGLGQPQHEPLLPHRGALAARRRDPRARRGVSRALWGVCRWRGGSACRRERRRWCSWPTTRATWTSSPSSASGAASSSSPRRGAPRARALSLSPARAGACPALRCGAEWSRGVPRRAATF
eukprot:scaffold6305_cov304-Prasinococcus_capsulatus_cf.AAC.3